ncbi:hypothetical protein ACLQ2Q_07140 [Microbacterium sp. DT81.1]|uniref:hypothetical protein n=1 Tax=Microbacterium sp. DT81.1 TaxID=3393413 RepID=UPI003CF7D3CD
MDGPLGSVDFADAEELARLRRRAYGPDADIAGDAPAQARLSELEAAQRRQWTVLVDTAPGIPPADPQPGPFSEPARVPRSGSTPALSAVEAPFAGQQQAEGLVTGHAIGERPSTDALPVGEASAASWWRSRRRWVILAAGIVALALTATHISWVSRLLADASGTAAVMLPPVQGTGGPWYVLPAPDDVLSLESVGADHPKDPHGTLDALGLSVAGLQRFENFGFLGLWSGESRYGTTCLLVAHPFQGLQEGIGDVQCSPEGLEAVVELQLCAECSNAVVFAGLPPGSLVRFVLKDDHVDVYKFVMARDRSAPPR